MEKKKQNISKAEADKVSVKIINTINEAIETMNIIGMSRIEGTSNGYEFSIEKSKKLKEQV